MQPANSARPYIRPEGHYRTVRITHSSKPAVSSFTITRWQRSLDTIAKIFNAKSTALVTRAEPDHLVYLAVSTTFPSNITAGRRVPLGTGIYCEAVLGTRQVVIVEDSEKEEGWKDQPSDKRAYMGYPILWPDGETFGTLCIIDDEPRQFTENERRLLEDYRDMFEGDLQRELYRAEIEQTSEQADIRIREIHHRVKNHFIILGQLMQVAASSPGMSAEELADSFRAKLDAIALLHNRIYTSESLRVSARAYIEEVADSTLRLSDHQYTLSVQIDNFPDIDQRFLIDVGLAISELTTNSIKYSQTPRLQIEITGERIDIGTYSLRFKDNGAGFSKEALTARSGGLGYMQLNSFAKAFHGEIRRYNDRGAVVECLLSL